MSNKWPFLTRTGEQPFHFYHAQDQGEVSFLVSCGYLIQAGTVAKEKESKFLSPGPNLMTWDSTQSTALMEGGGK